MGIKTKILVSFSLPSSCCLDQMRSNAKWRSRVAKKKQDLYLMARKRNLKPGRRSRHRSKRTRLQRIPEGSEAENLVAQIVEQADPAPNDDYNAVYLMFWGLGISISFSSLLLALGIGFACLVPYHALLASVDFLQFLYPDTEVQANLTLIYSTLLYLCSFTHKSV